MASSLEAKLIISAQDRTKAAFDAILRRLDEVMERARGAGRAMQVGERAAANVGASLGRVEQSLGAAARTMETAARSMERAASAMRRMPQRPPDVPLPREGGGRGGHGRGIAGQLASGRPAGHIARHVVTDGAYGAGGLVAAGGAYVAIEGGEKVVEKSAERGHELVRMHTAGIRDEDRDEAEKRAAVLAARYPQVDGTSILHTLRNVRAITGSYDDAAAGADDIMRMRIVANASKPGRDIEHETDQLLKAMEMHGDTMNRAAFHDAMTKIIRVLAVEGDTLGPADIYQASKHARQALPTASRRFLYVAAPALEQDMGGSGFGTSLSAFNRAFVDGRMDSRGLQTAIDLGLIGKKDVDFKGNKPIAMKPITHGGRGFKDSQLAASDPDRFIVEKIAAALKTHGITSPDDMAATMGILLSNRMAGQLVNTILTQFPRIQKSEANFASVPDDPAGYIMAHDPQAAMQGFENSFANLAASTDATGHGFTAAVNAMTAAVNDAAGKIQGVTTDHMKQVQATQEAGGRRDEARRANLSAFGIDTGDDLSKTSPDDLAAMRQKEIADIQGKIVPEMLRLKGLKDEIAARQADRHGVLGWLGFGQPTGSLADDAGALQKEVADMQAAIARLQSYQREYQDLKLHPAPATPPAPVGPPPLAPGSTYAYATGAAPSPRSPYGGLDRGAAAGPIEAELKGSISITSSYEVKASSSLLELVAKAEKIVSDNALIKTATGGDRGLAGMKVGAGASDTGVAGRKP